MFFVLHPCLKLYIMTAQLKPSVIDHLPPPPFLFFFDWFEFFGGLALPFLKGYEIHLGAAQRQPNCNQGQVRDIIYIRLSKPII